METSWNSKDFEKYSLECPQDRTGFITKVYSILSSQLLVTFFFVLLSCESKSYQLFVRENSWMFIVCSLIALFLLCLLFCFRSINRTAPYNFLLLSVFTLCKALAVSAICTYYNSLIVLICVSGTLLMTACLTGYAWTTKTDFTVIRGFIVICAFLVFFVFIMCWRLGLRTGYHYLYCPLAVGLYGVYLIYDTQLIVGEKRHKLSYDDYILGSVMLYVDILGIFTHLLKISKRK